MKHRLFFSFAFLCSLFLFACSFRQNEVLCAVQTGQLLRLHILAHSDEKEAQRVKLCVRDAVLSKTQEQIRGDTFEEVLLSVQNALPTFQKIAGQEAKRQGFTGNVQVRLSEDFFPTRIYGNTLVPAGLYKSVRITLGEGKGHNWWCVLYPSLCLIEEKKGQTVLWEGCLPLPGGEEQKLYFTSKLWELWQKLLGKEKGKEKGHA